MIPLALSAVITAVSATPAPAECAAHVTWPHWDAYTRAFVSPDGRVIDHTAGGRSTSEGQAYGLFLALVFDDRPQFERMLRWTTDNLAQGDLGANLPAWLWSRDVVDGTWRVLDPNPASDSDLWIAYVLIEAGRLWNEPRYDALGRRIAALVVEREVATLPGLGAMLLPAPYGFVLDPDRTWRLNPSYLPPQLLRRLDSAGVPGPWKDIERATLRMVRESSPRGFVPDWVAWEEGRFLPDPVQGSRGSYDAIRTYLWFGMLPKDDPSRREVRAALAGPLAHLKKHGRLPERIDPLKPRDASGNAPPGFYAALLPLAAVDSPAQVKVLEKRLREALSDGLYGKPAAYYDQNLALFGRAHAAGLYAFESDGRLVTTRSRTCAASP